MDCKKWDTHKRKHGSIGPSKLKQITFGEVREMYNKKKNCNVKNRMVKGRVLQRWGLDLTVNPKCPLGILLGNIETKEDFLVVNVHRRDPNNHDVVDNYNDFARLPVGATISLSDFRLMTKKSNWQDMFLKEDKYHFEVNVTLSNLTMEADNGELVIFPLMLLDSLRGAAKVEAIFQVIMTKSSIKKHGWVHHIYSGDSSTLRVGGL